MSGQDTGASNSVSRTINRLGGPLGSAPFLLPFYLRRIKHGSNQPELLRKAHLKTASGMNNLKRWDPAKYDFVTYDFMLNYNDQLRKSAYEN